MNAVRILVVAVAATLLITAADIARSQDEGGQSGQTVRLFSIEIKSSPEIGKAKLKAMLGLVEGESYPLVFLYSARDTLEKRLHLESGRFFARVTAT